MRVVGAGSPHDLVVGAGDAATLQLSWSTINDSTRQLCICLALLLGKSVPHRYCLVGVDRSCCAVVSLPRLKYYHRRQWRGDRFRELGDASEQEKRRDSDSSCLSAIGEI